jgi:Calcineurin-like phosphoesterase
MKKPIRLVFVLSDIHCGSTIALMPPNFKTLEGTMLNQNPIQQWLWACWQDTIKWIEQVANGEPYAVVLNGDLIEGNHHRTMQVISPDVGDHVEAAIHSLRPIVAKANKVFIVKGTECHTGNTEIVLGKALKTEINPVTKQPAWDRLTIDINGVRCVWRHHIGTSVRRGLAGTQLSVQLAEEQVEAANANETIPRVLCCAHRHKFGYYQDNNGLCVVSPPYQGLTRFAHKVVSQARTNPGVFALDFRGKNKNELPQLLSRIYESEKTSPVTL